MEHGLHARWSRSKLTRFVHPLLLVPEEIQRVKQLVPDAVIAIVTKTTGQFFAGTYFEHPEQEAKLLDQYYADSLRIPGTVSVLKSVFDTKENGYKIPRPLPVMEAYLGGQEKVMVVDPTGMVIYVDGMTNPFEISIAEFVRRLH